MTWSERLLIIFVLIATPLVLIAVPVYLLSGGLRSFAARPLRRCFEGIDIHEQPQPGDVQIVYHTYRGLLLWGIQTEHRVTAPPNDAEKLLKRLLRFNLTWGMLSHGCLFIPFLATSNYLAQRRSIERQVAKIAFVDSARRTS